MYHVASICQSCGNHLYNAAFMQITDAQSRIMSNGETEVDVKVDCPYCGFRLIAYKTYFEDHNYALDQISRMLAGRLQQERTDAP